MTNQPKKMQIVIDAANEWARSSDLAKVKTGQNILQNISAGKDEEAIAEFLAEVQKEVDAKISEISRMLG